MKREWYDQGQFGQTALDIPEPNEQYAYGAYKFLSWWPAVNGKGASYFPEDVPDQLLKTLNHRMVSLDHDDGKVIATIAKVARTNQGVEGVVEIDRDKARAQGLDLKAMRGNSGYFNAASVELIRDPTKSKYMLVDNAGAVVEQYPTEQATEQLGLRRTTNRDPYRFNRMLKKSIRRLPSLGAFRVS